MFTTNLLFCHIYKVIYSHTKNLSKSDFLSPNTQQENLPPQGGRFSCILAYWPLAFYKPLPYNNPKKQTGRRIFMDFNPQIQLAGLLE